MTMAMALRGPEFSTMDVTRHDWKLARDLGLPISSTLAVGLLEFPIGQSSTSPRHTYLVQIRSMCIRPR